MRRSSSKALIFSRLPTSAQRALSDDLGPLLPKLFDFEPAYALKPLRLALRGSREQSR